MEQFPDINWASLNRCRWAFHWLGWAFAAVTGMATFYTFFEAMPVVALGILLGGSFLTAVSWLVAILLPFHMYTIQALWDSAEATRHWNTKVWSSLRELTLEQAAALAYEPSIQLSGLTTLFPEVAEELAKRNGQLYLNGLTTLSLEVAKALAKRQGGLGLNGLTEITPEVAEALAKHEGFLALNRLTTITPEVAEALAKHQGWLYLEGLTTIVPEIAEALAKHKGWLGLYGITTISPEALKILRANPDIGLPSKYDEKP